MDGVEEGELPQNEAEDTGLEQSKTNNEQSEASGSPPVDQEPEHQEEEGMDVDEAGAEEAEAPSQPHWCVLSSRWQVRRLAHLMYITDV